MRSDINHFLQVSISCSHNQIPLIICHSNRQPIAAIPQNSLAVAYEVASLEDKTQIHCTITHFAVDSNLVDVGGINRKPFGIPIFLSFGASFSCAQILEKILMYVITFARVDSSRSISEETLRKHLRIRCEADGRPILIPLGAKETLPAMFGNGCMDSIINFELEWVDIVDCDSNGSGDARIHWSYFTQTDCHPSYLDHEKKIGSSDPSSVSLYECFDSFTQPGT